MAQFPAFPLWTDAYLADTGHLTTIEHGAYLLLLVTMWRNGGALPNDDRQLAKFVRMTSGQWLRIKPTLMSFFKVSPDSISQGRLTDELAIVRQKSAKQSNSARAKWRKENNKRHASADAKVDDSDMPNTCQVDAPISTPTIEEDKSSSYLSETSSDQKPKKPKREKYPEAFEAFWNAYPRSANMSKKEAYDEWKKLDEDDQHACHAGIAGYRVFLKEHPNLETIHACRFISKRRFEGHAEAQAAPVDDPSVWTKRMNYARTKQTWDSLKWGPLPHEPGCLVPGSLLQPNDGAGWREWEQAA